MRKPELEDGYAGSRLVIPDNVKDRIARNQVEVVQLPDYDTLCRDPDCDRRHTDTTPRCHPLPEGLDIGAWCLTAPRSLVALPGAQDRYLVALESLVAVFVEG